MTNEELEKAFDGALAVWNETNPMHGLTKTNSVVMSRIARYFFWAGSEFGLTAVAAIYSETFGGKREANDA